MRGCSEWSRPSRSTDPERHRIRTHGARASGPGSVAFRPILKLSGSPADHTAVFPSLMSSRRHAALVAAGAAVCALGLAAAVAVLAACVPSVARRPVSYSASELGIEVAARPVPRPRPAVAAAVPPAMAAMLPEIPPTTAPQNTYVTPGERPGIAGCPLFPRDHAFHASIRRLGVHPGSQRMIDAAGGRSAALRAGFSAKPWQGARAGYPVNVADSRNSTVVGVVPRQGPGMSDLGGHPVPETPRFEGWPSIRWDAHLLVVDPATCTSHEMIGVSPPWTNPLGMWLVDKAVTIDLRSNEYRDGGTVRAGGVSMLAGLVRYDEVAGGDIGHVISMSMPNARSGPPVWPAVGSDGRNDDPDAPPMGSWFRLRAEVELSRLGPQARVVARALQDHGGVVVDTSPSLTVSGEPDVRWDDADLRTLGLLSLADFEVVDPSPMMVHPATLRIR
jgi:hypothetical protein